MASALRLADLLGGLSMVADLGFGLPPQTSMRACVLSTAFARHLGLPEDEVRDAFYTALLMHIGCVATSLEGAKAFGDEIRLTQSVSTVNLGRPMAVATKVLPAVTRGMKPLTRASVYAYAITRGAAWGRATDRAVCEVARDSARRLGLPVTTQRALHDLYEWWDGHGPRGVKGEDIDPIARIVVVAGDAAHFDELGGPELAEQLLRDRVGMLEPDLVERFIDAAGPLLEELNAEDPRERLLTIEPVPVVERAPHEVANVAQVFGDVTDMKTPFFHGHAAAVADLATAAGTALGMGAESLEELRVAALLHDVGRAGVSSGIWGKEGPLTAAEREQVRMHPYHSERILSSSSVLAPMARLAGLHHERLDGSGYHRSARAAELPLAARVLAAADSFCAMTAGRPHRAALRPDRAASELSAEVRSGAQDAEAVGAVLAAAGHTAPARPPRPGGLSAREIDVLRLVSQDLSNAQVAAALHISRRTAEHHIQHIYAKIGVSTRAGAALFGLEHGLLHSVEQQ